MHLVNRDEWGMPPIGDNHTTRPLHDVTEFNVHYSDSHPPSHHRDCASVVRAFDSLHRSKGWACIGYTGVVCSHGYVFAGRPITVVPAAAEDHNAHIVAYCLINDGDAPTREQWLALKAMRGRIGERVGRHLKITTHREVEPPGYTSCPGEGVQRRVNRWRKNLSKDG
jgi:hypothetical protein